MKDNSIYIDHILDSIRRIKSYTNGLTKREFSKNELVQDAVIRNFEIIGEASKKVSSELKKSYPNISWKDISGMRDKLIHDYIGVDIEVLWATIKQDLPILKKQILEIKMNLG